ncbi:hypothetical protein N9L68_05325 [bacterium]|nr:hypothetical protein [bacterium]
MHGASSWLYTCSSSSSSSYSSFFLLTHGITDRRRSTGRAWRRGGRHRSINPGDDHPPLALLVPLELWMAVHELAQLARLQLLVQARVRALVGRREAQVLVADLRGVERAAVSVQSLIDDVRGALPRLILGQRRSLRASLAHARPHVHWQSLVLRAQRKSLEKLFQQSVRRNRPVLRAQKDLERICQKKLRDNATLPLENTSTRRPQSLHVLFLLARILTPNEFANVRRSALLVFCTSLAAMSAALAPASSAILPDAGGVTWAWLELAEPGSTVSALKVCASAGPREADRTATPELAEPGSPACARERSC